MMKNRNKPQEVLAKRTALAITGVNSLLHFEEAK